MIAKSVGLNEYRVFLDNVSTYLDNDFVGQAKDVELGQWELSFEAVLLELMKEPKCKAKFDTGLVEKLAIEADIIECGVLDMDTWQRFCKWGNL